MKCCDCGEEFRPDPDAEDQEACERCEREWYREHMPEALQEPADERASRCLWSRSGACELAENALAAVIHGNTTDGDPCEREGGPGFCYLATK